MCSPLPGDSLQGYVGSFSQLEGGGEEEEMPRIRASTESNSTGLISYKRAVIFLTMNLKFFSFGSFYHQVIEQRQRKEDVKKL